MEQTLTDEQLHVIGEMVEHATQRAVQAASDARPPEGTSWNRRIDLIIGFVAIISLIFSVGVNWSRIGALEIKITEEVTTRTKLADDVKTVFTGLLEQKGTSAVMNEKLDSIQRDMSDVKRKLDKE